jgi:hypothetical protein
MSAVFEDSDLAVHGASRVFVSWCITRSKTGDGTERSMAHKAFWRTNAERKKGDGDGSALGWSAKPAAHPQEARFPDGAYVVHVVARDAADLTGRANHAVVLDNWRPFVEEVTVGAHGRIVHQGRWAPARGKGALLYAASRASPLPVGDEASIIVVFSEPMRHAQLVLHGPGTTADLDLRPDVARVIWSAVVPPALVALAGSYRLEIRGLDLAEQPLVAIAKSDPIDAASLDRRGTATDAADAHGSAGDTLHAFEVAPAGE